MNERHTAELEKILSEFPFLQSARAIYLKGLYNQESFRYNTELKKTAAYTTDRSVLFDFITSEQFHSVDKKAFDEKEKSVAVIAVNDSEIIEPIIHPIQETTESLTTKKTAEKENTTIEETIVIEETIAIEISAPPVVNKLEEAMKFAIKAAEEQENAIVHEEQPIVQFSPEPIIDKLEESIKRTVEAAEADKPKEIPVIDEQPQEQPEVKNEVDIAEEKLDIGKPLEFGKQETHSFAEWLKISKLTPINREEEPKSPEQEEAISKKMELIDKFIETNPKIAPVKNTPVSPANIERFSPDNSSLMTETLARVYLEQKKYSKAIQAYEILILKYPEKSVFFADHISDIKILQQNNN